MLIKRIRLTNLLSFGPDTEELELEPLNVLIGPNGSGKSNFIEALGLLKATPRDLTAPSWRAGASTTGSGEANPKRPLPVSRPLSTTPKPIIPGLAHSGIVSDSLKGDKGSS